jgi:hypothetical protein
VYLKDVDPELAGPDAYADRGYDHDKYRRQVRDKGITPVITRRGTDHGSGLDTYRWVVEQPSVARVRVVSALRAKARSTPAT